VPTKIVTSICAVTQTPPRSDTSHQHPQQRRTNVAAVRRVNLAHIFNKIRLCGHFPSVCVLNRPGTLSPQSHVEFMTQMLPDDERAALDLSWAGYQTGGRAPPAARLMCWKNIYNQILEFKLSVAAGKLRNQSASMSLRDCRRNAINPYFLNLNVLTSSTGEAYIAAHGVAAGLTAR
jgi:hypothetical protein